MNDSQKANWEQIKAKGFWYFVLVYWGLTVGGSMIIGLTIYDYFFSRSGFSFEKVLINSVSALITTFFSGIFVWYFNERRYRKNSSDA